MDTTAERGHNLHAIIIPLPFQGHITPSANLAVKLASKGFIVTFVLTQSIHHQLISKSQPLHNTSDDFADLDLFTEALKSGLDIRCTTISDGLPLEFDRSLNFFQFLMGIQQDFPAYVDEFVGNTIRSEPSSTFFLIADTFYTWTAMISNKYSLMHVSFWTQPAMVFTLYYHLDLLKINGHFGSNDNRKDTIEYIPGVREIKPTDLISYLQDGDTSTVVHRIVFKSIEEVRKADFILVNTVQGLESETILALHRKKPFYAVGPLFPIELTQPTVETSLWPESDCMQWLNTKRHGTVLYVSFGSIVQISKNDILEIAHGLLLGNVNFVWVFRPHFGSSKYADFLPIGWEDGIKNRGLMVPWCRQMDVISHPAIGGFLTHCGWNSILESMRCGVPLLCFPLHTDQFTNRKLKVDDWRIGINLCDHQQLVTREEVARKVKLLMGEETSEELRRNIKKVRDILENASAINGSSEKNLDRFIRDVKVAIQKRRGLV